MMTLMPNLLAAMHPGFFYPVQASTIAREVDPLAWFIHGVTIFFTVAILAATAYFTWKYRASVHPIPEPPGHNNVLEVLWTGIPAVVVFICFFWGFRVYMRMNTPKPAAEQVDVTAQMWAWRFNYRNPNGGPDAVSDELYLPVNTPVLLKLNSMDVIHALYLPAMRMKKDVVPGRYNEMYVEPTLIGDFSIYCAEYCGDNHSQMRSLCHVLSAADYKAKLIELSNPIHEGDSPAIIGERIVRMNGCGSCHSVDGTGGVGPTWKDMFGQTGHELADGSTITVDDNYVMESIRNPQAKVRKGFGPPSAMNPFSENMLPNNYIPYIIAYMKSISVNAPKDASTVLTQPMNAANPSPMATTQPNTH